MLKNRYVYKSLWKRAAAYFFDLAGTLFFFPFKAARRPLKPESVKRILIVRLDHIGDLVMTRPAAAQLREYFPLASIDWLVPREAEALFRADLRTADGVIALEQTWFSRNAGAIKKLSSLRAVLPVLKRNRYDLAIDFRGDIRNILMLFMLRIPLRLGYGITGGGFLLTHTRPYDFSAHQIDVNSSLFSALGIESSRPAVLPFFYPGDRGFAVLELIKASKGRKIIIQPSAGYPSKNWPHYEKLIHKISESRLGSVFLIGTEAERNGALQETAGGTFTDLRGKTRLEDLPPLFGAADLFIGNDSGPAHIAAAQGIPVICIFSAVNPLEVWRPRGPKTRVFSRSVSCSPCYSKLCPLGHHQCMRDITVEEIFDAAEEMLKQKAPA